MYAQEGIRIAEEMGSGNNNRGWLFMDRAMNELGLGRYDDAFPSAETALRDFRSLSAGGGRPILLWSFSRSRRRGATCRKPSAASDSA